MKKALKVLLVVSAFVALLFCNVSCRTTMEAKPYVRVTIGHPYTYYFDTYYAYHVVDYYSYYYWDYYGWRYRPHFRYYPLRPHNFHYYPHYNHFYGYHPKPIHHGPSHGGNVAPNPNPKPNNNQPARVRTTPSGTNGSMSGKRPAQPPTNVDNRRPQNRPNTGVQRPSNTARPPRSNNGSSRPANSPNRQSSSTSRSGGRR